MNKEDDKQVPGWEELWDVHEQLGKARKRKFSKTPRVLGQTDSCRIFGSLDGNKVQGDFHITARGHGYLLATRSGQDRTYRLSRVRAAEELDEPASRPVRVDLERAWHERSTRFRTGGDRVDVLVRVDPERREDLVATALAVSTQEVEPDGWLRVEVG